jgi:hypothetical protein
MSFLWSYPENRCHADGVFRKGSDNGTAAVRCLCRSVWILQIVPMLCGYSESENLGTI